ncbi:MAG: hypothetical protein K6G40_04200 [Eubacterium sp.]|nr:hypothetical protein [Eubacterium sp.]
MNVSKASFTVEASLLMPFILGILLFICMLGAYLADIDIAYFNAAAAANYTKEKINEGENPAEEEIASYAEGIKDRAILGVAQTEAGVQKTAAYVKVSIRGKIILPFMRWLNKLGQSKENTVDEECALITVRPEDAIREYRLAGGIL